MAFARRECEFFLLKYVPDPVRNEFVHVGVILREVDGAGGGPTPPGRPVLGRPVLRFTKDWKRVRCLDPDADTEMLEGLESELRRRFVEEPEGNLFHVLEDSFSNCVQMTRAKAYLAESMETGVEELMRLYVEPQKRERVSRLSGRAAIQNQMRGEFERAGVWDLMRKRIDGSQYTRPGDPLRIDLGYRSGLPGGYGPDPVIRMFQAVSLEPAGFANGVEMAKNLAFSANSMMAGVQRMERASLELTAVVEPVRKAGNREQGIGNSRFSKDQDEADEVDSEWMESYRFAVETMEEHRIRVLTTSDLGRVAATARRELFV